MNEEQNLPKQDKPDRWAKEKARHAKGGRIEHRCSESGPWTEWNQIDNPIWVDSPWHEYRTHPGDLHLAEPQSAGEKILGHEMIGSPVDFADWWKAEDRTYGGDITLYGVAGLAWEAAHKHYTQFRYTEDWKSRAEQAEAELSALRAENERLKAGTPSMDAALAVVIKGIADAWTAAKNTKGQP